MGLTNSPVPLRCGLYSGSLVSVVGVIYPGGEASLHRQAEPQLTSRKMGFLLPKLSRSAAQSNLRGRGADTLSGACQKTVAQSFLMLTIVQPSVGLLQCLLGAVGVVEFALAVVVEDEQAKGGLS